MKDSSSRITKREDAFASRASTRIWEEVPAGGNPYIAEACRCHGYDLLELVKERSFSDVFFLIFRGELPTSEQEVLLEKLMIGFINPGPRHPAVRSAMNAGIGKTDPALILPVATTIMSGAYSGAGSIDEVMRFLRTNLGNPPQEIAATLLENQACPDEGDCIIAPGFGSHYGDIDLVPQQIANYLVNMPGSGQALRWGSLFAENLYPHGLGWLPVGIIAATLTDLGFSPKAAAGIYQIISAPGMLAHGVELYNKPITAMPFIPDENYMIEDQNV